MMAPEVLLGFITLIIYTFMQNLCTVHALFTLGRPKQSIWQAVAQCLLFAADTLMREYLEGEYYYFRQSPSRAYGSINAPNHQYALDDDREGSKEVVK